MGNNRCELNVQHNKRNVEAKQAAASINFSRGGCLLKLRKHALSINNTNHITLLMQKIFKGIYQKLILSWKTKFPIIVTHLFQYKLIVTHLVQFSSIFTSLFHLNYLKRNWCSREHQWFIKFHNSGVTVYGYTSLTTQLWVCNKF